MLYTHALAGSKEAARFLSPQDMSAAPQMAYDIMALKLKTYLQFNATYPGFGGYLPWYANDVGVALAPTWDWNNRVPGLDNGYVLLFLPFSRFYCLSPFPFFFPLERMIG
jgi:hypothetical protein